MESLRFLLCLQPSRVSPSLPFFFFYVFLLERKILFTLRFLLNLGARPSLPLLFFFYSCDFCHSVSDESFFAKIAMKIGHLH